MKQLYLLLILLLSLSLTTSAQTKYLWCNAAFGGAHGHGTILQGDSDGTNFHSVYSFDSVSGSLPVGRMVLVGDKLYGVTELGGHDDSCCIIIYDPKLNTCIKVYDFADDRQAGFTPVGGLILATDGKLYGTTTSGGLHSFGVIYSFDPATNTYTDVHDFDTTGIAPGCELLQASDGKLYGIAQPYYACCVANPPHDSIGKLFSFDITNNTYTVLATFPLTMGITSYYTPIQASDGRIYGVVSSMSGDSSALYRYDPLSPAFAIIRMMNSFTDGRFISSVADAGAGKLYGVINDMSNTNKIYSYDLTGGAIDSVAALPASVWGIDRNLSYLGNGKFAYGTYNGGANSIGALVSFDLATRTFTTMMSCDTLSGYDINGDVVSGYISDASGIVPISSDRIYLYPNPAADLLHLSTVSASVPYTVTNIFGEEILKGATTPQGTTIDISHLPAGLYFIDQMKFVKQ